MGSPCLDCPKCGTNQAEKLIGTKDGIVCNLCWDNKPKGYNYMLHSKEQYGVTQGKRFEIDNRVMGPEGKVINKKTGRPAQY